MSYLRAVLTGVGGQGTLTATKFLAQTALGCGIAVSSGEIHGMAQRGGVVISTVLFGGYDSPKIDQGEADLLLGFEPMETLRALAYVRPGKGTIVSSLDVLAPLSVSMGKQNYPDLEHIKQAAKACAARTLFVPCRELALEAGTVKAANTVLLGAAAAAGVFPFGLADLEKTILSAMKPQLAEINRKALALGAQAVS